MSIRSQMCHLTNVNIARPGLKQHESMFLLSHHSGWRLQLVSFMVVRSPHFFTGDGF